MPHTPLQASPRFRGSSKNGIYGDAIQEIDWSTGAILAELERLKISRRTLVVFLSDNGPENNPRRPLDWGTGSNGPFRGWKNSSLEGGMRVPCVMYWPGRLPGNVVCDEISTTLDILPTIAHLAEIDMPDDRIIDGGNLSPLLLGESKARSPHYAFYYYLSLIHI